MHRRRWSRPRSSPAIRRRSPLPPRPRSGPDVSGGYATNPSGPGASGCQSAGAEQCRAQPGPTTQNASPELGTSASHIVARPVSPGQRPEAVPNGTVKVSGLREAVKSMDRRLAGREQGRAEVATDAPQPEVAVPSAPPAATWSRSRRCCPGGHRRTRVQDVTCQRALAHVAPVEPDRTAELGSVAHAAPPDRVVDLADEVHAPVVDRPAAGQLDVFASKGMAAGVQVSEPPRPIGTASWATTSVGAEVDSRPIATSMTANTCRRPSRAVGRCLMAAAVVTRPGRGDVSHHDLLGAATSSRLARGTPVPVRQLPQAGPTDSMHARRHSCNAQPGGSFQAGGVMPPGAGGRSRVTRGCPLYSRSWRSSGRVVERHTPCARSSADRASDFGSRVGGSSPSGRAKFRFCWARAASGDVVVVSMVTTGACAGVGEGGGPEAAAESGGPMG